MPRRLVALLAVALLSAAACGGSGDDGGATPADEDDGSASVETVVEATDFAFEPATIEVDPGETVHVAFTNAGDVPHTFTIGDLDFDQKAAIGEEVRAAFTAPDEDATLEFFCRVHPSEMTGEIVVGDGGSGSGGGSSEEDSDTYDY